MAQQRDDADLVLATRAGDGDAFGILFDRWFDRVWDVAWHVVRDREVAAEVAQDVFLVAWQRIDDLREPAAFGGWLLRTSRNRALNRLERERRTTPAGGTGDPVMAALPDPGTDPATAVEDRSRDELVWAAAAALGERDASVLDLHLRHGLTPGEIAEALDVAPNHAHQLLFRLKERLAAAIRSWVLWRHGVPRCADLRTALAGAGIAAFGPDAVRAIGRHAGGCEACTEDRDEVLAPERLFAMVPLALAPPLLKAKAAAALESGGVPMAGSRHGRRGRWGRRRRRVAGSRGRRGCGGGDHRLGRRTRRAGRRRGTGHRHDRCHGKHSDRSRRFDTSDAASHRPDANDVDDVDHGRARHRRPRGHDYAANQPIHDHRAADHDHRPAGTAHDRRLPCQSATWRMRTGAARDGDRVADLRGDDPERRCPRRLRHPGRQRRIAALLPASAGHLDVDGHGLRGNLHRDRRGVTYAPTATFSLTTLDDPPSCIVMP